MNSKKERDTMNRNNSNSTGTSGSSSKRPYNPPPPVRMNDPHDVSTIATMVRQVAATATRENTLSTTTTMKMDIVEMDHHHKEDTNTNSNVSSSSNTNNKNSSSTALTTYQRLPFYGEHKRAISTVKIAPDRICYQNHVTNRNNNYNSNNHHNHNIYETMTASASADGICKLWNISLPYYYSDRKDHDDSIHTNSTNQRLVRGIMRSNPYNESHPIINNSTTISSSSLSSSSPLPAICMTPYTTLSGSHTRGINDISWNPILPYFIATASDDKTVKIWDCIGGGHTTTTTTNTPSTPTTTTTPHSNNSMNTIHTSSHPTTSTNTIVEPIVELIGHDHFVFCVDQYRHIVATGSFDETIKLWDIRTGYCISTLPAHSDPVTSVAFNRDGTMIVSGSHDGLIRFWDVMTGECLKTLYAMNNPPVSSVTFAPNGKYILAGTLDNTLRLWPVTTTTSSTNSCTKTYRYNEQTIHPLHDQNRIGSSSGTTKMDSSSSPYYFRNTKYSIASSFMYDGNILVGNETGHPMVFDLQSGHVLQVLHPSSLPPPSQPPQSSTSTTTSNNNNKTSNKSNNSKGTGTMSSDTIDQTTTTTEHNVSANIQSSSNNDDPSSPNPKENAHHSTSSSNSSSHNNAVLAVSAHDTQPLLCMGSMGTKRVEFWSLQPIIPDHNMDHKNDDDNDIDMNDNDNMMNDKKKYDDPMSSYDHHHTDTTTNMMVVDPTMSSRPMKQRKNQKSTKSMKQRRSN